MPSKKKTHKTKDGRTAKKGLYYNINKKRKEGRKPRKSAINPNAKLSLNDAALDKVFEKLPNQLQHIISICSSYGGTATIEQINTAWVDERMNANEKYTQDVFTVLAHYKNAGLKRLDNKTIFQLELINLN